MIGLSSALARLSGLRAALAPAAQKGVHAALTRTLKSAQSAAPVDTGRLRGSLSIDEGALSGAVKTACPYASAVEFGTRRASAQPFLAPAAKRADFQKECQSALKEVLHG